MRLQFPLLAGLLLGALSLALPAAAQGLPPDHEPCPMAMPDGGHGGPSTEILPPPGGEFRPPFLRGVKLSEAQQDKIFEVLHAQAKAMRDKFKALQKADMALRNAGRGDDARLGSLVDARAEAWSELTLLRLRSERQIDEVLIPEQRRQVEQGRKGPESAPRGTEPRPEPGPQS